MRIFRGFSMSRQRTIEVIGAPSDLGANIRGSNMGPASIRIANLKKKIEQQGFGVIDLGDLHVPIRESVLPEIQKQKYLTPIRDICSSLADITEGIMDRGNIPITLGGEHSLAIGSIGGILRHYAKKKQELGLIWVDAHADVNTPTSSPSGNIHGMPLAVLLGQGHPELLQISAKKLRAQNTALIGIRNIDDEEKRILRESNIKFFTMREIDEKGMFHVMREAIAHASDGTEGIHVSFDIDGIDPRYAPGVSTPVSGGLTLREAHLCLEMIFETNKLVGMDMVELNPLNDQNAQTASLVVDLILSGLGKSIV
ncbi:MAG: arginase [Proteobacteria bacterium]|nr:MAG: arginase [Pseudomonadota bacterium]